MRSISFRFISIFVVLVLVTTVVFGALFVRFFYKYDLEVIADRVDGLSELIIPRLQEYDDFDAKKEDIASYIGLQSAMGFREQIFIINKDKVIATGSAETSPYAEDLLDTKLLILGESGSTKSKIVTTVFRGETIRSYDKVYPILKNDIQLGILYIKYDLKDLDESSYHSMRIIVQSLAISLALSLILAVFISRSITKPINEVTKQASKMAMGNFNDKLVVKSDDEIGELSVMFNYMADKLSMSIDETYKEKNKMEAIVNNIGDALIAVDNEARIIHINPAAEMMLYKLDLYKRFSYSELSQGFPKEISFDSLIKLKNPGEFRYRLEADDYCYEVRCEYFYDERGSREGFIVLFQDVTKEAALENMRRDFIANVSHELKTPITSIQSYSETMLYSPDIDKETSKNFLSVINEEAARMGRLVNDLLQLSGIDAGKVDLKLDYYNWNTFIRRVASKLKVRFEERNIKFTFIEEDPHISGKFDYDRMEQVMNNLLTNAVKYNVDGGEVIVKLKQDEKYVYISVKDTGIGIDKKHISHLFNRFYRVEKSRERKMGGSGLGLAIVKQMLELHSADIELESELGKGTEFRIRFPKSLG